MPLNNNNINNIPKNDDDNFLKDFLKEFYRQIVKMENYNNLENTLTEWMKDFFKSNKKNSQEILKLMENHQEKEIWFSSLIGFFYEHGISDNNNDADTDNVVIDKNKSLELYLLSINNDKNKHLTSVYQILNIIIAKYLLSFYYYRDIL